MTLKINSMKFRIKKKNGSFYPQVKRRWYSLWQNIDQIWCNWRQVESGDQKWFMYTSYKWMINTGGCWPCGSFEKAEKVIDECKTKGIHKLMQQPDETLRIAI